eukprot:scaffold98481_cov23-Tisochrysis_lutea.AAC.1
MRPGNATRIVTAVAMAEQAPDVHLYFMRKCCECDLGLYLYVQNDVAWRRHKEREAVAMADDGAMPPLYPHHTPAGGKDSGQDGGAGATAGVDQGATGAEDYGCTFGTEMLEPGPL